MHVYASAQPPSVAGIVRGVSVTSRHLLVAQAVGAALQRRDVPARVLAWDDGPVITDDIGDVMLLLDELDSRRSVLCVRAVVAVSPAPVVVLAGKPMDATWGAVLDGGAAGVLDSTTSLEEVEQALQQSAKGEPIVPVATRRELIRRWHDWSEEERVIEGRLWTLSPRESGVLGMLAEGLRVFDIAERLGVSETTVRSHVKAMRRKLHVDSQLAAVAVARRFVAWHSDPGSGGDDPPTVPMPP